MARVEVTAVNFICHCPGAICRSYYMTDRTTQRHGMMKDMKYGLILVDMPQLERLCWIKSKNMLVQTTVSLRGVWSTRIV